MGIGPAKLVKAGFVVLDTTTGAVLKIVVFQYNPETLVRRLEAGAVPAPPLPPFVSAPHETVSFTVAVDAADKLEAGDAATQQNGVYPALSALELLMYPTPGTLTVWVSGSKRVEPVRITEMQIAEQAFDSALNPIRVEALVTLQVLKDADLANNPRGKALWDAHFNILQQLARLDAGTLAAMGITGI